MRLNLTVRGLNVHVSRGTGSAGPAVLVHSSGMSGRQWLRLGLELEARRVSWLAPDLVGYGRSDAYPDDGTSPIDLDLEAVLAVVRAAKEPVILVGHSYGGFLALRTAALHPELVRAVAVHEPVAWGALHAVDPKATTGAFLEINHDGLFFDDARGGSEAWFRRFVGFWMGGGAWETVGLRQQQRFLKSGRKTYWEVKELCEDRTPPSAHAAITAPVRVSCGEQSPPLEHRVCRIIADVVKDGELLITPGGHMGPLTHPEPFHELVFELCARA